jgi:hypothetical protein
MKSKAVIETLLVIVAVAGGGCGGGTGTSGSSGSGSQVAITVSVAPSAAPVPLDGVRQFTAAVTGTSNALVTWSLSGAGCSGAGCGTLSGPSANPVTFSPPSTVPTPATVTLVAKAVDDPSKSASAIITITEATGISVSIDPTTAILALKATQQFTATVLNDPGNGGVTWRVKGEICDGPFLSPQCGTVSPAATASGEATTYTAPSSPPPLSDRVTLRATSVSDDTKSATAGVTIK